jgi:hypothetical protein
VGDIQGGKTLSEESKPATFSNVALTLISIVVALGIEHLLGHIGDQISDAEGTARFLVAAQGVTTFLAIGAIWIAFATMLMTAAWEPRFQDFFAPLLILSLLYFWISAIGASGPSWFYIATIGWAIPVYGNRFGLPEAVASRWRPRSAEARPLILSHVALCLLAAGGGAATQMGALGGAGAAVLVSLMAVVQLLGAWFHFQWWRSA